MTGIVTEARVDAEIENARAGRGYCLADDGFDLVAALIARLDAANAALSSLPEQGWRDVRDAPKDGTQVLFYIPPVAGGGPFGPVPARYAVVWWESNCWVRCSGAAWTDDGCIKLGAIWQPLPAPSPSGKP